MRAADPKQTLKAHHAPSDPPWFGLGCAESLLMAIPFSPTLRRHSLFSPGPKAHRSGSLTGVGRRSRPDLLIRQGLASVPVNSWPPLVACSAWRVGPSALPHLQRRPYRGPQAMALFDLIRPATDLLPLSSHRW